MHQALQPAETLRRNNKQMIAVPIDFVVERVDEMTEILVKGDSLAVNAAADKQVPARNVLDPYARRLVHETSRCEHIDRIHQGVQPFGKKIPIGQWDIDSHRRRLLCCVGA